MPSTKSNPLHCQSSNRQLWQIQALLAAAISPLSGCFHDDGPNPDVLEDGQLYCAKAVGAEVQYMDPTEGEPTYVPVEDPENRDGPPRGCACANEAIQLEIEDEFGNVLEFEIDSNKSLTLQSFRDEVIEATLERCDELVSLLNPQPYSDNCAQVLADEDEVTLSPSTAKCKAWRSEEAVDEWGDYYALNSVITFSGGKYMIDQTFFEDVLANPAWLLADSTYIAWNGSNYQFYDVTSGDIAYALGLQSGSVPLTLNGFNVTTPVGAIAAMIELFSETEFVLVLAGPAGPLTRYYEIDP